jgi:hypothetical protein
MSASRGALLSGTVNVRLLQLLASVVALLFTTASVGEPRSCPAYTVLRI